MNKIILGFFAVLLTARFFSETLKVAPKALDLIDLAVIPLLCIAAAFFGQARKGVDRALHGRMLRLTAAIFGLSVLSAIVNLDRTHYAPVALFTFGLLEGPALFLALNALLKNKEKFAREASRFLYLLFIAEGAVVVFVNLPMFFSTGNPDYVSGTFGLNAYQFSAFLVLIGGYFLGRMRAGTMNPIMSLSIQAGVVLTFLFLQYRTATPAFFAAYLVLIGVMYGRKVVRMIFSAGAMAAVGFLAFSYVASSAIDLKFDDLLEIAAQPAMLGEFGKVIAYGNVVSMYGDQPVTFVVGAGPGTMVSRSAYTFIIEPLMDADKGVGKMITSVFGTHDFQTDVFKEYIQPLFSMEAVFGSDQANNPASSILAAMAEIGIPGLILVGLLYWTLVRRSLGFLRYAAARLDAEMLPLAAALVAGAIYLVLLCPLDNYFEIARVTLPVWLLFWTVSSFAQLRRDREQLMRLEQLALLERIQQSQQTAALGQEPLDVRAR